VGSSPSWFAQSVIATLCLIPAWLAIGFFNRNFGVRTDVFLAWYMFGVIITVASSSAPNLQILLPKWWVIVSIVLVGATFGALANILLFRAIPVAPNPGLPIAIAGIATPCVFLVSVLLGQRVPKYFSPAPCDVWTLAGVVLIIGGATIIAVRR